MAAINDKQWLAAQLDARVPVRDIANAAGVSRQTVYAWIKRHRLARTRPTDDEVAAAYEQCRTTAELGAHFEVSAETARRWLIAAGIDRRRARLDVDEVRRKRSAGATIAQLADEYGVGNDTIRRRLDPKWDK